MWGMRSAEGRALGRAFGVAYAVGRVPYGYTILPVLRKRSDVKTYWMAVGGGLCCGEAAMYAPVWVISRVEVHFSKGFGLGLALFGVGCERVRVWYLRLVGGGMSSSSRGSNFGESDASYGELSRRVVEVLERLPPRALGKWIVCCYLTDDPGRDVCGVMAHYAKKVGASEDLFAKIRDQLATSSKGEGSSKAPALAGPVVETEKVESSRQDGGVAPGGTNNPDLGGFEKAKVQMRKGVEIKLTDPEVALVEAANPGMIMRAWNEYTSRGLVLGRLLSAMMQEEIVAGDKKKLADELATLKVQVELDQRTWDEEKKKLEAEVKKLKVGVLAAEKKLKLKQVEVDELQARKKAESEEAADGISGLQQAVYTEHVKGFEKALRQADFLYKEVSVTDCRFNINLDIYDNKMLDVAKISKLKALAEGEEVARDEEGTLMMTPINVGDDRASNEEGVGEEAEAEAADGDNDAGEE
ncbi:hypothetical protein DEO72_LG2g3370 [Vigna unguiculata]|uniref:Uncharacterized protein n=1 Tax=Vigna unguiculata TaxID=3917 RepID=A0A4D6L3H7_VIGUN|nr:hypothetical protein DEO72_LG2g3370 [Vigna unguiculata]